MTGTPQNSSVARRSESLLFGLLSGSPSKRRWCRGRGEVMDLLNVAQTELFSFVTF